MQCFVCGSAAPWQCHWPVIRSIRIRAADLKVGDRLLGDYDVLYVSRSADQVFFAKSWKGNPNLQCQINSGWLIWVYRRQFHGVPCCDAHVRQVADDRHYCRDHWRAWETVRWGRWPHANEYAAGLEVVVQT